MIVKPKKHLGQHFLIDEQIAFNISETLRNYSYYNKIIEVGPGTGMLTKYLLKNKNFTTFVSEVDTESVEFLKINYHELSDRIISEDFLKLDLINKFNNEQIAIIGNYPYNISSQILFKALDNKEIIPEICGMFQKEVAERVVSNNGTKVYGILSVLIQAYYNVEYLFTVDETVFNPPPKVKSGVIRLTRKIEMPDCNYSNLKKIVKVAFGQRRKKIKNPLKSIFGDNLPDSPLMDLRVEQLSVQDFIDLSNLIK